MFRKILIALCVCNCVCAYSQSYGDFRTNSYTISNWEQVSNWEQFNGNEWIAATESPGQSYSPHIVTIKTNCTATISADVWNFPIQKLIIESSATCYLENKNIKISESLTIQGTFSNNSSTGLADFNSITVEGGIWNNNQPKNYVIHGNLSLSNATISGNGTANYEIQGNLSTISLTTNVIDKAGFEVFGETFFNGNITFTSTAGDKIFHNNIYLANSLWKNIAGETFTIQKNLLLQNSTIENQAFSLFNIAQNMLLHESKFLRFADFYGLFNVAQNMIIEPNTLTQIESACLNISGNIDIYGTMETTDKKGVKTIFGDFKIHENGTFTNTGNDRFIVFGNLINQGTFLNGTNGIFELQGTNKNIEGIISTPRLQIEGTYTNLHSLEVKVDFIGSGMLTQAENATLIIQTPTSTYIIANATGNTVRFTKRANQTSNCSEFYNLILSNNGFTIFLNANTRILNSLQFEKSGFLECNGYVLTFENWHESMISGITTPDRGIIMQTGNVFVTGVNVQETAFLPIFHKASIEGYARIDITNYDSTHTSFSIDSLIPQSTDSGIQNYGFMYQSEHVQTMYHISSESTLAKLKIYWHTSRELFGFERNICGIQHHNGYSWDFISEPVSATQLFGYNIFSISGTTQSFSPFTITSDEKQLPIQLMYFTAIPSNNSILLSWKTMTEENNDFFTIQKSYNGIDFFNIETISGMGTTTIPHNYEYTDNEYETGIVYYRLTQTDYNGTEQIFEVENINISNNSMNIKINHENKEIEILLPNNTIKRVTIYSNNLLLITASNSKTIEYNTIPHGIYFLKIETNKDKIWKKLEL